MRVFQCGNCAHPLFFENVSCERCGHGVGYNDTSLIMNTFPQSEDGKLISDRTGNQFKYCQNKGYDVCNWLIEAASDEIFCTACKLNRTIPNLNDRKNFEKWQHLEIAKHRLIYQLQRLNLKLISKCESEEEGLCFDFLARQGTMAVMTGHANGVITILLAEADSVLREQMRKQMSEPYRTLIGHFRHEVGHYFWERLVATDEKVLKAFRDVFGDERIDYSEALKIYYKNDGKDNWQENYISKYATSHPWEDWAETWAHYLHLMDMTETAYFFGLQANPAKGFSGMNAKVDFDPYELKDFDRMIEACVPLSFAVNSINRSMGLPDVYPFVIHAPVIKKMRFIQGLM